MRLDRTFSIDIPPGWNVAARRKPESLERLIHAATIPLPRLRGDYGSGVLVGLGPDDVFLSIMEHGREGLGTPLFADHGVPVLRPSEFATNAMQQVLPGRSAGQWFFTAGGSTWCIYAVLGSHARRSVSAVRANQLLRGIKIG
jgi:hypothetical protein